MITAVFWVITQRVVVISCRRFGTTYRSLLQGSRLDLVSAHFINNTQNLNKHIYTCSEVLVAAFRHRLRLLSPVKHVQADGRRCPTGNSRIISHPPWRYVADTMALLPIMLQFFYFFPDSNHFTKWAYFNVPCKVR
jgi:hypothetical protein